MSLFSAILEKLGIGHKTDASATSANAGTSATATAPSTNAPSTTAPSPAAAVAPTAPVAVSQVDVLAKLDAMAAASSQKLNWKVSITDLLKLLGLDSSLEARKGLATELGCPKEAMGGDYAAMNIWLHKAVLQRLAANGGNIPKELL